MKKDLQNITVLYNLPKSGNPDDLDTQKSASGVVEGLKEAGYDSDGLGISEEMVDKENKIQADLVFNLVEWTGHDYELAVKVINNLEKAGLPYTGSNAWGYQVSGDKVLMKKLLTENKIPTPNWLIARNSRFEIRNSKLNYPLIVKPTLEHCAIGISQKSVVGTESELRNQVIKLIRKYDQSVLVEEFIEGDEAQVTVLEKHGQPWVLPPAIFRYQKKAGYWPINTYAAKWGEGWEAKMSDWVDKVDKRVEIEIESLAQKCYRHLGGRSYPRIDMRINGDKVYVLEVNNNPGIDFDPDSGITVAAKAAGLDWPGLLTNIVEEAYDTVVV